jgi:ferric-dicitrate binding protein FerR (iron transport regulator)
LKTIEGNSKHRFQIMKKDYSQFTAIDFAKDTDFLKWVKHPQEDESLNRFWQDWLREHPSKQEEIDDAKELIYAVLEQKYIPGNAKQREVWHRINETLSQSAQVTYNNQKSIPLWKTWMLKAASIVVISVVAFVSWTIYNKPDEKRASNDPQNENLLVYENREAVAKTIFLSDGTSIVLQPSTSLKYPKFFKGDLREVYLTGEAFFEVKKDPARPFIVHANELVTRVIGTSFTIRNFDHEDVLVRVKTGKVSVFKEQADDNTKKEAATLEGVVLTANQQVLYAREQMKLTKSLVEDPAVLVPLTKLDFEFTDTPIKEVFQRIENSYGVDIVYDEEALSSCFLNASLSDVALYDKLSLICKGIDATYEMMDSHIIIYGKGCKE